MVTSIASIRLLKISFCSFAVTGFSASPKKVLKRPGEISLCAR